MPNKNYAFDRSNPTAVEWADKHAADLISGISKSTREDIADLVERAMEGDFDVAELSSQIADMLGDDARAETIARTETAKAANEGQVLAWDQAAQAGLINPDTAKKEWITTPDDKLCPVCEEMDGEQVGLDEDFDVDGEAMDAPPAHPNCRCVVALVV